MARADTVDHDGAVALHEEVAALLEGAVGPQHPASIVEQGNLGVAQSHAGQHERARTTLAAAIEAASAALGAEHPRTAALHGAWGLAQMRAGALEPAEHAPRRSLQLRAAVLADDHPQLDDARYNLALVLRRRGQHAEAAALLAQGLAHVRARRDRDDPLLGPWWVALAESQLEQGDTVAAQASFDAALRLFERGGASGRDYARVRRGRAPRSARTCGRLAARAAGPRRRARCRRHRDGRVDRCMARRARGPGRPVNPRPRHSIAPARRRELVAVRGAHEHAVDRIHDLADAALAEHAGHEAIVHAHGVLEHELAGARRRVGHDHVLHPHQHALVGAPSPSRAPACRAPPAWVPAASRCWRTMSPGACSTSATKPCAVATVPTRSARSPGTSRCAGSKDSRDHAQARPRTAGGILHEQLASRQHLAARRRRHRDDAGDRDDVAIARQALLQLADRQRQRHVVAHAQAGVLAALVAAAAVAAVPTAALALHRLAAVAVAVAVVGRRGATGEHGDAGEKRAAGPRVAPRPRARPRQRPHHPTERTHHRNHPFRVAPARAGSTPGPRRPRARAQRAAIPTVDVPRLC
ncbi:MAG: hypothetical protein U0168_05080 [Nannocystaceae bacterium]